MYADDRKTDARKQRTEAGAGNLLPKSVQVTEGMKTSKREGNKYE